MQHSEFDKMLAGEYYDYSLPEVAEALRDKQCRQQRFNSLLPHDEGFREALEAMIPGIPASSLILPPFRCDYGRHIGIGENVFINANCTMLDSGGIRIGNNTMIGPDCKFYTPEHPFDYKARRRKVERALRIEIGDDCWLCGNVTVCPGVKIGDRTIIAAGSVVVGDIPSDVMAAGNPATVKRRL